MLFEEKKDFCNLRFLTNFIFNRNPKKIPEKIFLMKIFTPTLEQYDAEYADEKDHPGMSPFLNSMLTNGNYFFTAIFAVESFAKLAAMSPRYFFAVSIHSLIVAFIKLPY